MDLQQVNDQSDQQCVSYCTHCVMWSRGALAVGGVVRKLGECYSVRVL